jgi:hypothetical protein
MCRIIRRTACPAENGNPVPNALVRYKHEILVAQTAVRDCKDASNYQLSYRHFKVNLFSDMMFSKVKSL